VGHFVQTALAASVYVDVGRIVDLGVSGMRGDTDAGGGVREVVVDSLDGLYNSAWKLDTEDDAVDSEGEYDSNLKSGLKSLAREIDGIESWSMEIVESRFWSPDLVTEIVTPPLLLM
jgi:hypothetical protein